MEDLIDQSHSIHLSGTGREIRRGGQVSFVVDTLCENSGCMEIGKDHIAIEGKKGIFKLIFLPCFERNMKFHIKIIAESGKK